MLYSIYKVVYCASKNKKGCKLITKQLNVVRIAGKIDGSFYKWVFRSTLICSSNDHCHLYENRENNTITLYNNAIDLCIHSHLGKRCICKICQPISAINFYFNDTGQIHLYTDVSNISSFFVLQHAFRIRNIMSNDEAYQYRVYVRSYWNYNYTKRIWMQQKTDLCVLIITNLRKELHFGIRLPT